MLRRLHSMLRIALRATSRFPPLLAKRIWRGPDSSWNRVGVLVAIVSTLAALVALRPIFAGSDEAGGQGSQGAPETGGTKSRAKIGVGEGAPTWYSRSSRLPTEAPPRYDEASWMNHCDPWKGWLRRYKMAPISNIVELGITAPPDSPVTIAAVKTTTFQRYRIENGIVVQCQYGAGGEAETTIYPDLDSPQRRVPMDTDGDDEADTEMPGGRFVIRAGEFEWLTISAQGTKGYVYEIGVRTDRGRQWPSQSGNDWDKRQPHPSSPGERLLFQEWPQSIRLASGPASMAFGGRVPRIKRTRRVGLGLR